MDMVSLNEKARGLCDAGVCCSMGEARRAVMHGAFDRFMKRTQQKNNVENQDSAAPKSDQASQPNNSAMDEICAHYVQFEDCVFFPGDVACGEKGCAVKPRRLRQ